MGLTLVKGNGMTVGQRIIDARKAKDMTQLDLARRLGVSRAAVGQWEIDATSPSIAKLEEVGRILNVSPEYLAYNVKPGDVKVVYRSPERDNIVWVNEITFGDSLDDIRQVEGSKWGMPSEYLSRTLRADPNSVVFYTVDSHAVEPDYEYGDLVVVDRADRRPSSPGIFLYWDGAGAALARLQVLPGSEPKVRISQKNAETMEIALKDIHIIGRVKGRFQRG